MKAFKTYVAVALAALLSASPVHAGVTGKKISDGAINAAKLNEHLRLGEYVYEVMDHQPMIGLTANGYADPTGAGPNTAVFRNGLTATYTGLGTQTIVGPVFNVTEGLLVSQDATDDDGVQYTFGALGTAGAFTHVVGTDSNKFLKIKFEIEDVSGTDDCAVCFRKNEAVQANIDDYDEMACINVISGDIKVETILNNATTVTTDSTLNWADGEEHTLELQIIGRRVVFKVDGAPIANAPEFNFDSGEVIVPHFFLLNASDVSLVYWKYVEVGPLSAVDSSASDNSL